MGSRKSPIRTAFWAVALGVAIFAVSRGSLELVDARTGVAAIWPAAGLGLAALVLLPRATWPLLVAAIAAGGFAAGLTVGDAATTTLATSLCLAVETYLAAIVLLAIARTRPPRIGSLQTVGALIAAGAGVTALTAVPGALILNGGFGSGFGDAWQAWWMAHAVGILVVTPVVLALLEPGPDRAGPWETLGLIVASGAVASAVFWHEPNEGPIVLRFAYPVLPLLLWCSVRIGARATTFASVLVAAIAALATARGLGPFAVASLSGAQQVQILQGFLVVAVLSTLLVGALVADQRRARGQARHEADRLASVLRASSEIAIVGTDIDGTVTVFGPGAERITGRPADEVLGRSVLELHDPAELAERAAGRGTTPDLGVLVEAARAGGAETSDWTYRHADGSARCVALTVTGQHDADGRLTGYLSIGTDVTARRAAARALAASEARHRLMVSSLPDMQVYLLDAELRCVLGEGPAIPAALRGIDFVGMTLPEMMPVAQLDGVLTLCRAALLGTPGRMEYRSRITGRLHDLQVEPYRSTGGDPDGVLLVMRDVTDRDEQLQALRRAEADLRTIFDQAPIGQAILDAAGALIETNAELSAITGYAPEQLRGVGPYELVHPDDLGALQTLLGAILSGEIPRGEIEVRIAREDGQEIALQLHAAALSRGGHEHERALVQCVDVTHRRQLEEQLRALADRDVLTGLYNRRRFDEELEAHVERSRRYGADGAVIVLDVDDFKLVNDTFGHHAGDELIVAIGDLLRDRLRGSDVVARLGGDEFAVLLPHATASDAEQVARSLVSGVRADLAVTISLGVAMVGESDDSDQLMIAADRAMYEAKSAGRDGHAFAAPV